MDVTCIPCLREGLLMTTVNRRRLLVSSKLQRVVLLHRALLTGTQAASKWDIIFSMAQIRIALAQTSPISAPSGPPKKERPHSSSPFPSLEHNLVDVVDHVERAKAQGAEVIVFPEYFLQGMVNEGREVRYLVAD